MNNNVVKEVYESNVSNFGNLTVIIQVSTLQFTLAHVKNVRFKLNRNARNVR